ncbi:hypothetical protein PIIN_11450 [Serendipita indica DSM 11827]|uniref:Uncharacterized protein n=1 Tax=Serendipita indica (strain DSM 11827) TaxID=1109443 RepID=G4U1N0_SERID|nr:hypothetical protein PIIN_11450 [Serendipita indica DSM 11827]
MRYMVSGDYKNAYGLISVGG